MYKSIYYDRRSELIHLWTDESELPYTCFPYKRYAYRIDPNGSYITMNGLKVSKVTDWSTSDELEGLVFEHDVQPTMRVLIDRYYDSDDVSTGHTILFFDIEVSKEKKYSKAQDAFNPITSISYYDNISQEYVCLLVNDSLSKNKTESMRLEIFSTERELLSYFLDEWESISPSIIVGWNSSQFDIPYLFNRLKRILGQNQARRLSPIGIAYADNYKGNYSIKIAGVNSMDYMVLYKKFTYNEEASYKLEAISQKELGKGKIEYEGSLDDLYRSDISKFIDYNIRDVELIVELDRKLDFIAIAQGICHKGHVSYDDFEMSSRYLDGACLTYGKRNNIVLMGKSNRDTTGTEEEAEGAFVKLPKSGLYRFVYDLDLESEYPNNIRTLNISPETKWGRIVNWDSNDFASGQNKKYNINRYVNTSIPDLFDIDSEPANYEIESTEIRQFLDNIGLSVSATGILYKTNQIGLLPAILTSWGAERKSFRKTANEYHESGDFDMYKFYDRKQLVQKILLNSLYGVLLLPTFRFYDLENGESITLTGQQLVQFSADIGNYYYNNEIRTDTYIDYCIYQDTDSCFFQALPIIQHRYGSIDHSDDFLVEKTLEIATEVQDFINKSYDVYAYKYHNVRQHTWHIKQEMVGKTAFWRDKKKRYAMWIINKTGLPVDEYEIKGFDSVRSDFPKSFRKFMKESIIDVLNDVGVDDMNAKVSNFKNKVMEVSPADIMLPTSVKEISKWAFGQKGVPIHVKSAQNYNKMLELLEIESIPPIQDMDKILWAYLYQNPYNFPTMAITGYDDPIELMEFLHKYIDRNSLFEKRLLNKMQAIWDNLGWGTIMLNSDDNYF